MDSIRSADIIRFPRPASVADAEEPGERLRRALVALEAAVAQQRSAVAAWRGGLDGLDGTMRGLRAALMGCDAQLGVVRGRVDAVLRQAK
jgi:hypothetical protein